MNRRRHLTLSEAHIATELRRASRYASEIDAARTKVREAEALADQMQIQIDEIAELAGLCSDCMLDRRADCKCPREEAAA